MAPLAGRPPFATDEPETFYQSSPQPRARAPQQQQPEKPTSAYDVYDSYLSPGDGPANRNSGIGALGMGFMTADMGDEDSDDEEDMRRARNASSTSSPSKHAALAAATGAKNSSSKGPFAPERLETPPPQYNPQQQQRGSPAAAPRTPPAPTRAPASASIAAPRPGYAPQMSALNQNASVSRPAPSAQPAGRPPPSGGHPNLRIVAPAPQSNGSPFHAPSPYGTPSPSGSPHPLQAPVTPITPVFARPQRTQTMTSTNSSVGFSDTKGLILRGDGEETLLPRGRGEKGEQFWRRFSMVAKDPEEKRPSTWLQKTQGGASRLSRWVWIVGLVLIICAAGGIGMGVYISEQASSHYRPDAIGGSADAGASALTTAAATKSNIKGGALATTSALHISPTNTVARRAAHPLGTALAGHALRNRHTAHDFAL
ncbi:hypothetical protein B0H15DRAFT_964288 [Mycena belliarum]|uniref:Uncharacterized protein n=1 Tax=Mycena belliarum TaxID=1033014 RepID=A0AAD6XVH2_9AGAR|nr:hypothetical protein B0H15DRAFT_964288 [Mycena belliae]